MRPGWVRHSAQGFRGRRHAEDRREAVRDDPAVADAGRGAVGSREAGDRRGVAAASSERREVPCSTAERLHRELRRAAGDYREERDRDHRVRVAGRSEVEDRPDRARRTEVVGGRAFPVGEHCPRCGAVRRSAAVANRVR
ncbi:hypothetical protein D7316_03651 [Gordonia insulae]|uniref:Uncharacterized protein n=1 Tax=Gordonia insulae TaxID=2420509 RepID=A0A3G8JPL3_9ACTN|nr:hypothetical protein D7316_03651 [Gordonia insulae]